MTERERMALAVMASTLCCAIVGWLGFNAGALTERQSRDAVACTPFVDSVRVVPLYRPRGPVPGAPGRTP